MILAITSDTIMGPLIIGAGIICWMWAIFECVRDPQIVGASRKRWIAFVALVPGIGALCYLMDRRARRKQEHYPLSPPTPEKEPDSL